MVSVYLKTPEAPIGPESLKSSSFWHRHVVDDYGSLSAEHTGTIHNVSSVNTGAAIEPFGIACMGARECLFFDDCFSSIFGCL
jgi:hypothetical protein